MASTVSSEHISEFLEKGCLLKGSYQPLGGHLVGLQAADRFALIEDFAGGRFVKAADDVKDRRFAGTVRADQTVNCALLDFESEIVDSGQTAEILSQPLDPEKCLLVHQPNLSKQPQ